MAEESTTRSLEYTPTWIVAGVCFIIVSLSFCAERGLHRLGKLLKHKNQDALFEALQKLKEELMLLGFISLLLTVTQNAISRICIPTHFASYMLPCKLDSVSSKEHYFDQATVKTNWRRLLSSETGSNHCVHEGKVPLLSLEALHQLHIFIFVLAVVHVVFCVTTMLLGGARIREWKIWEDSIKSDRASNKANIQASHHHEFFKQRAAGYWRKYAIVGWTMSFFKQFYGSVTKADYMAMRHGFIMTHCPSIPKFDFHKYMLRTLEIDFKRIVSISWYLWLFVVFFLLLNVGGWHTYFWLSFLPLVLLLVVGAKLERIITQLAEEDVVERKNGELEAHQVKPSDKHFWFGKPRIVLYLIHFVLFQNSFEIAFFFWILSTYGFESCIMEKVGYIVPRLIIGVIVQVLCSYCTLPLYAIVTQMGSMFKEGMFNEHVHTYLQDWAGDARDKSKSGSSVKSSSRMRKLDMESCENYRIFEQEMVAVEGTSSSISNLYGLHRSHSPSP